MLQKRGKMGDPMGANGITHYLIAMKRYFTDLTRRPHTVGGEAARRIKLDFLPKEVLTTPDHIRKLLDTASPSPTVVNT